MLDTKLMGIVVLTGCYERGQFGFVFTERTLVRLEALIHIS